MILWLLGCLQGESPGVLPVQLSLMVQLHDGSVRSLLVELGRVYEHQLDVREAEGPLLYDGRHLWQWQEGQLQDLLSKQQLSLPESGELLGMDRNAIWMRGPHGTLRCDMTQKPMWSGIPTGNPQISCEDTTEEVHLRMNHPGPGEGFSVSLEEGTVYLRLPADREEGQAIRQEVSKILGLRWVREPRSSRRLEKYYRGQASFTAHTLPVEVDGNLGEWGEGMGPLVVQRAWQVEQGRSTWSGPQDASFSVAVVRSAAQLCLAGRIRDDERTEGDTLIVYLDKNQVVLPLWMLLSEAEAHTTAPDKDLAVGRDWYGAHYEACLPLPPLQDRLSFSLSYSDVDEAGTTLLSTAPPDSPAGVLHLSPGT
ncbi:MAG TPA: hypothetical protein PKW90_07845 [Myxococcota bacterium]|nr:hypothetical protein [Myxococcota bacterium]